MGRLESKVTNQARRQRRTRATIQGTAERPRLAVRISNRHIMAQIINDIEGKTLVSASTAHNAKSSVNLTEQAKTVGSEIAQKAKDKKIKRVVFDRRGRLYHGRIKALADTAREAGLEF